MSKARDFADIAGAVSNGKIASTDVNVSFENIVDTGTEGTKVAAGTTGQRGSTAGQWRYNSTIGKFEGRGATSFISLEVTPNPTSVNNNNPTEVQINAGFDIVITGTNFSSGDTVKFIGNDATEYASPTVAVDSATQITARVPTTVTNANEPFKVRVTSGGGLSGTLNNAFNVNGNPVWSTASGTLAGGFQGDSINVSVSASDPEGSTVTYSETTSVLSGIGTGFTLNTSSGAITGTLPNVGSGTTYTFTIRATADSGTTDREFSIYNAGTGTANFYTSNTTLTTTFPRSLKVYVIGGGGGGGGVTSNGSCGAAGGGGGGMAFKTLTNATAQAYTITVGAGGLGGRHAGNTSSSVGTAGGTSSFAGTGITTIQATGGAGGEEGSTNSSSGSLLGSNAAGGVGSGGDTNGTGGTGGRRMGGTSSINGEAGNNGSNGAAGGGGGGTDTFNSDNETAGDGGNGSSTYYTGGGGGGGCDRNGTVLSQDNRRGYGGSGYSDGGKGGGLGTGFNATAGSDTSNTSSGGATNQVTGDRNNNG